MEKSNSDNFPFRLLRPTETARALGVTVQTLSNFRFKGVGPPFVKLGSAVRYRADTLDAYIRANERQSSRGTGTRKVG